jgi:hypothetical protein
LIGEAVVILSRASLISGVFIYIYTYI